MPQHYCKYLHYCRGTGQDIDTRAVYIGTILQVHTTCKKLAKGVVVAYIDIIWIRESLHLIQGMKK